MRQENLDAEPHTGPRMPEFERIEGEHPNARYKRVIEHLKKTRTCRLCDEQGENPTIITKYGLDFSPRFGVIVCKKHPKHILAYMPTPPIGYKAAWVLYCKGVVCKACGEPIIELKGHWRQDLPKPEPPIRVDPYPKRIIWFDPKTNEICGYYDKNEFTEKTHRTQHVCVKK